ncbi:MAG: nucleotide sugar dehydrogenase [Alphaproteobacteria bacterium]|nr:nucleotide sugar dehydrogenase [Alphaproteobacteria bacterium]
MTEADQSGATPDVCIVGGAGHVGLPLGLVLAHHGMRVLICDLNRDALATIQAGEMPALDEGSPELLKEALANDMLTFTDKTADAVQAPVIVVTIGTSVDEFHSPDQGLIRGCIDDLMPGLTDDHLIILRSTVYPGTTDWVDRYLKKAGKGTLVSFCPERVVQGKSIQELQEVPQIVSGTTPEATLAAAKIFDVFAPESVELTPMEAEFAKLFTNAYRYIQFAITNEFFSVANSAGVNYHNILGAITKNYPRAKGIPTPGFTAGPCLFKDTMQLVAYANNQFNLGTAGMLVNEGLVLYVIDRLTKSYDLSKMTVGILGMAFKADSDDIRSSLSYKMKKVLVTHADEVIATDPLVTVDDTLLPLDEVIDRSDLLILCTPHSAYKDLDTKGKPVADVWNYVNGALI